MHADKANHVLPNGFLFYLLQNAIVLQDVAGVKFARSQLTSTDTPDDLPQDTKLLLFRPSFREFVIAFPRHFE